MRVKRYKLLTTAAIIVAMVFPGIVFSQAPFLGTGRITGRVTASASGEGIEGVKIMATSSLGGKIVTTDSSGNYVVDYLFSDMYRVYAYTDTEFPGQGYVPQYYSDQFYFDKADAFKVSEGETVRGIDFSLNLGVVFRGRVIQEETGLPVSGLTVGAYTLGEVVAGWGVTDLDGRFDTYGYPIRDGYYRLFAYAGSYNEDTDPDFRLENTWYPGTAFFGLGEVFKVGVGEVVDLPQDWEVFLVRTPTPKITPPQPTPAPTPMPLQIYQVWGGVPGDSGDGIGQATLVFTPNDEVWIFDCGDKSNFGVLEKSCPREVLYLLDSLGYDHIDKAVVSHFDADHCYGFITLANGTGDAADPPLVQNGIGQIPIAYDRGGSTDVDGDAISIFYTAGVVSRQTPNLGTDISIGAGASLRWLAMGSPNDGAPGETNEVYVLNHATLTEADGDIDENAKSIVSAIIYGGFDFYIGGDSTSESLSAYVGVEEAVSSVYQDSFNRSFDVILLDHHGSRFHTPSYFLSRTAPEAALAAVWDNSYGHPNCTTLDRVILYTETGPGRQSVFQVAQGDLGAGTYPCNQYTTSANAPIRIYTDGYYYSIEPRSDLAPNYYSTLLPLPISRYTSLNAITDLNWFNHPVDGNAPPTPTPPPTPLPEGSVIINEVNWAGTAASYYDEWMEFYNRTDQAIDISDWTISSPRWSYSFSSAQGSTVIPPGGYWVFADKQIFSAGATVDMTGSITLYNDDQGQFVLRNGDGIQVDAVNPPGAIVWCGGSSSGDERRSMERKNPGFDGTNCDNWCTYNGIPYASDTAGLPVLGSPGQKSDCYFVTPSVTPTPIASATPSPTPFGFRTPSPSPTTTPPSPVVVINEIAWSGTAAGGQFEWIELYNATDGPVDLTNWFLDIGSTSIDLTGSIAAKDYYLLERYQSAVSDIPGDMVTDFGSISNLGELVSLINLGLVVDFADCLGGWYAGSASPGYYSMERVYAKYSGNNASNWKNNNGIIVNGLDANGNPLNATARALNSSYEPSPVPTPRIITPTPSVSPITPTPTVTPFGYETPPPTPPPPAVVINEIAWMGTAPSSSDEWMELYNNTGAAIDLTGWTLASTDGNPNIALAGSIGAHSYYLIERTDDNVISDIPGDLVISFGTGLSNSGEYLQLKNAASEVVDEIDCSGGWWGGDNTTKETLERIDPDLYGKDLSSNWGTWAGPTWNGRDSANNPVNGTAKAQNSIYAAGGGGYASLDSGDYDGDSRADLAIFRPSVGLWYIRNMTRLYLGQEGDIPVTGDYDGNGVSEPAVYRPNEGLWIVSGGERFYFGRQDDIPVPRDYNGDGITDPSFFRPADGLWKTRDGDRIYLGRAGDLPAPADYDGDGSVDFAVYRASGGLWIIKDIARRYMGKAGDIPIPGDYNGDGTDQIAVNRPWAGLWIVEGERSYLGTEGDFPVPADYDGDGVIEPGIFRSSEGLWKTKDPPRTGERIYFGKEGDIPATR